MANVPRIRDVWAQNLDQEMHNIRSLVEQYPYISMDTEFPGVVARPIGTFKTSSDYHYQTMRCNVDLLKIIQIGITLSDADGNMPEGTCTWQFNFHFSVNDDMYSADSIELLQKAGLSVVSRWHGWRKSYTRPGNSDDMYSADSIELLQKAGLDFNRHEDGQYGIKPNDFAELLITSGLVLFENVKWISFHRRESSGYDFGYLLRLLTNAPLPSVEEDFFELVHIWFPNILDIKYITRSIRATKGGLQEIADELGVGSLFPNILDIKYITRSIRATKGGLQEIADELGVGSSGDRQKYEFNQQSLGQVQRVGPLQQAGSDALLTSMTFFKMKEHYFPDQFDESKYSGQLYGLGPNYNPLASSPSAPTPAHVHHTAVSHNMNISLPGMSMQMNGMNSMGMGQPFPTPGLYPSPSVGTPFGPSGPTPPAHAGGMGGMGMGGVGMYGMPGHNVR
ncbi:unnamed protein product [Rhizoctonia solani]|uniref:poly(A)-specific ribonuclease n=1 Tax=Rhizoctonia solani TaxID=456999 RepID=A0A8H3C703_9AGAM|nr:unnamed protein product [Rhizoctonia solani]